jgi:cation diffusion facilitator family transporter
VKHKTKITAVAVSLAVGAALTAVKFTAYSVTGSTAILSDALESVINVVAAGFGLVSVIVAAKPPDKDHPYGHGKMEFFSAGFEGSLIVLAALAILYEGVGDIAAPGEIPRLGTGLMLMAGAGAVNLVLGVALVKIGRTTDSRAVAADGKHLLTDVYTTVGVITGLVLVKLTGLLWLDGVTACAVALNILWMGGRIVREAFSGLMDKSDPELIERISKVLSQNRRENWIDVHRLRAWQSGDLTHVDFHLLLPRDLSFQDAHNEIEAAGDLLRNEFDGRADVIVHGDPCEPEDCPACGREPCEDRSEPGRYRLLWDGDKTTERPENDEGERHHEG